MTSTEESQAVIFQKSTYRGTAEQDAGGAKQIRGTLAGSNRDCFPDCRHHDLFRLSAPCMYAEDGATDFCSDMT